MSAARKDKDGSPLTAFGYELNQRGVPIRGTIDTRKAGDYGADPIGDGTFRMVPSGDIVDFAERCKRLTH